MAISIDCRSYVWVGRAFAVRSEAEFESDVYEGLGRAISAQLDLCLFQCSTACPLVPDGRHGRGLAKSCGWV